MKKLIGSFFAVAMILSLAFVGDSYSTAQGQQVSVKRKKTGGLVGATTRGAKYVYRKGKGGTRYVYRKGKQGTVYVGKQTYKGGKWTYGKGKSGIKKVGSATKKVLVGDN